MGGTVYAIAGGKGGVGKTTTTVNLGVALQEAGESVVVVDGDLAMTNLRGRLDIEADQGLHSVLAGEVPLRDVLTYGPADLPVISGERNLSSFGLADPAGLREVLDLLAIAYDIVLVDTGSGIQRSTFVTLDVADGVVLVVALDEVAIEDADLTADFAASADCPVVGTVVTRVAGDDDLSDVGERLDADVLGAVPEHRIVDRGSIVTGAPESEGATAYRAVAAALATRVARGQPSKHTPDETAGDPANEPSTDGGLARRGREISRRR